MLNKELMTQEIRFCSDVAGILRFSLSQPRGAVDMIAILLHHGNSGRGIHFSGGGNGIEGGGNHPLGRGNRTEGGGKRPSGGGEILLPSCFQWKSFLHTRSQKLVASSWKLRAAFLKLGEMLLKLGEFDVKLGEFQPRLGEFDLKLGEKVS